MIEKQKLIYGFLAIIMLVVVMAGVWFSLDKTTRCGFIYGKNICNFYAMMDVANHDPSISDFDEMMNLCGDMTSVPKKDGCFEYVAQTFTRIDINKAKEACDEIKGFDGVYSKKDCYSRIYLQSTKMEPTKEMVEKIIFYENGKQQVVNLKSEDGKGIAGLLTRKLHELNLQATCVFGGQDIIEIKQHDKVAELIFKSPIDITISQWVEPEERYHIPVDERGYRILKDVETALFIFEDNLDEGLEAHILVGHEVEGRVGYSCWAINVKQEGKPELDKTWIKQIEKTLTLEEFCGWSTYGNCSSDSDCTAGGCSGQVCQSKYEEPVITTCEWRDCFDASKYGLKCRCIDGRCQWSEIEPTKEVPTMMEIPHLNLTPQPGEYFTYRGNKSQILLNDSRLKYCFLELKDICPPDAANEGDIGIVITGTIKNEYDRDYYICMAAHAFNSEGSRLEAVLIQVLYVALLLLMLRADKQGISSCT
jgi:eight-cysteine-cluster-containing protein